MTQPCIMGPTLETISKSVEALRKEVMDLYHNGLMHLGQRVAAVEAKIDSGVHVKPRAAEAADDCGLGKKKVPAWAWAFVVGAAIARGPEGLKMLLDLVFK